MVHRSTRNYRHFSASGNRRNIDQASVSAWGSGSGAYRVRAGIQTAADAILHEYQRHRRNRYRDRQGDRGLLDRVARLGVMRL